MEKNVKANIDNNRIKCEELLDSVNFLDFRKDNDQIEKILLKICRISENIYRKTYLNKDGQALIKYYLAIINFYERNKNYDFVQRWHQKLVGILQESCESKFVLDDFRILMEWYIKTLDLMLTNKDYNGLIKMSSNMQKNASLLYKRTKTIEDLKFYVISKLMLGTGYQKVGKMFKAYHYYYSACKILRNLYYDTHDIGLKNDLVSIYESLYEVSNHKIFKPIAKRWKIKILLLKEK